MLKVILEQTRKKKSKVQCKKAFFGRLFRTRNVNLSFRGPLITAESLCRRLIATARCAWVLREYTRESCECCLISVARLPFVPHHIVVAPLKQRVIAGAKQFSARSFSHVGTHMIGENGKSTSLPRKIVLASASPLTHAGAAHISEFQLVPRSLFAEIYNKVNMTLSMIHK